MSEVVPHKQAITRSGKVRELRAPVQQLDFGVGSESVRVNLADETEGLGTCLGCHDAPCMFLSKEDLALPDPLKEFPGDPARDVCPTRAISWDDDREAVRVDADLCIGCGLCIVRCPYGALASTTEGKAIVEASDPDRLTTSPTAEGKEGKHPNPERIGRVGSIRAPSMQAMPDSIRGLGKLESTQLVRNLLVASGGRCRTRRRGDTNIRMDGVLGLTDGRFGVLEIEFTSSVLESPRALLEDVAVLHGRYGIEVATIDPISIILSLPNERSEYFQVVADIEKVLGIRCRTITVGALFAVVWQFERIHGFPDDLFMTSPGGTDLLPAIQNRLSASISRNQPYEGAYRPSK